jgi:hypothetical protein
VIGLVLVLIMAIIEFGLGLNALLSINFASRDAALAAAKAGNVVGADCLVLAEVERDVNVPADPGNIQQVEIYWSDSTGNVRNSAANVYARTGWTSCLFAGGTTITVPYSLTSGGYADTGRCNVLAGCGGLHVPSVDTVGVRITYDYQWHTPLRPLLAMIGSGSSTSSPGWHLVQANAMRMEPVL